MSDLLATALGLAFAMLVCLLAVHAILSPWLRLRRAQAPRATRTADPRSLTAARTPNTTPAR